VEEVEADPRWISAVLGTVSIGRGGSRRLHGLIAKRGRGLLWASQFCKYAHI
jgi:hypothetical protein